MIRYRALFICIIVALTPLSASSRDMVMDIIQLEHRSSDALLPQIEPFLDEGGKITSANNQLIIKTSPENFVQLISLIEKLDAPQKELIISVKQGQAQHGNQHHYRLEGNNYSTDTSLEQYSTHDRDHTNHQIRTLEGRIAYISTGKKIPIVTYIDHYDGHAGIDYEELTSGFYVVANLIGNEGVEVHISPFKESLSLQGGGEINTQSLKTELRATIGEWIQIGVGFQQRTTTDKGTLYSTSERDASSAAVMLKVDVLE